MLVLPLRAAVPRSPRDEAPLLAGESRAGCPAGLPAARSGANRVRCDQTMQGERHGDDRRHADRHADLHADRHADLHASRHGDRHGRRSRGVSPPAHRCHPIERVGSNDHGGRRAGRHETVVDARAHRARRDRRPVGGDDGELDGPQARRSRLRQPGSRTCRKRRKSHPLSGDGPLVRRFGGVLLSQGVYPQVPSALTGLTAVFGMGTGVTLSLWPPKSVVNESTSKTVEQARAVQSKPSAD